MEVASSKILHTHFCVWLENDQFHVEGVDAQLSVVVSEAHLNGFLAAIAKLVRGSKDRFFLKLGEFDRGRMKLSKFRSDIGWVLCCDFWPTSGHRLSYADSFKAKDVKVLCFMDHIY
ncbi:hypothetical protein Csa_008823 [Cucumis sativus]|nr:hypothetical protein Csa_008823 [Cucumis sativus]